MHSVSLTVQQCSNLQQQAPQQVTIFVVAQCISGGVLELNAEDDPELFKMARVGLGCLGVVTELTLQAVPAQKLKEKTFVASAKQVRCCYAECVIEEFHNLTWAVPS